jgi:hypothetical protein
MDIPMVGNTASRELSRMFGGDLDNLAEAVEANFARTLGITVLSEREFLKMAESA